MFSSYLEKYPWCCRAQGRSPPNRLLAPHSRQASQHMLQLVHRCGWSPPGEDEEMEPRRSCDLPITDHVTWRHSWRVVLKGYVIR